MRLVLTYLVACTDPLCCAFTGGDLSILTILNHAMISDIAFKIGDMYGAFDEDGTMVGFQAWVPPGKALFESRDKEQLGPYIARLPTDEIKAFVLHSVELNTHWCQFNFIKQEYHGKGISKAIMELPFEKSRVNGWTMALVTSDATNVPIYEHHGFVNEGHKLVHTPLDVVPLYAFVKKPE
ncbi:hypothetical protein FOMPIDRAFT_1128969 [Fomitopsis schrenkii]|uniref:N-acetyltransferase domain-containing protein n=1 Tax=Fomitopsis schrenkii TaxID=2126942 RepID=S8FFP2_FOMSC|nr:hypothetical protein FOMPIDRAFT_1128969 [Fomitopsis schrenkii]